MMMTTVPIWQGKNTLLVVADRHTSSMFATVWHTDDKNKLMELLAINFEEKMIALDKPMERNLDCHRKEDPTFVHCNWVTNDQSKQTTAHLKLLQFVLSANI